MKKVLALILALVLTLSLAACGSSSTAAATTAAATAKAAATTAATTAAAKTDAAATTAAKAAAAGETVKAVFCSAANNESQAFAYKMFQKHMGEYNIQVDLLDDQGDAAKQAENVAQAVSKGYSWIIVNPTDAAGIVTALKSAKEANPKVIISTFSADVPDDSEQYRDFFVGINDTDAGKVAAQALIEKYPNGCTLVEVGGQAGHNAQILRHDGFMAIMKDHPEFKILDAQNTEHWATDEAQSIMEDFITKYGDQIQAVFCHWDNGATGCISALQAAGMNEVTLVGVDGCKAGFDQVNSGAQYATIMNNFETDCTLSMELALKVMKGEKVDSDNYIKMDVVTKSNISSFTSPEW